MRPACFAKAANKGIVVGLQENKRVRTCFCTCLNSAGKRRAPPRSNVDDKGRVRNLRTGSVQSANLGISSIGRVIHE